MFTTSGIGSPSPVYSVDVLVPWFETQKGLVGASEIPQGLIRLGSTVTAGAKPWEARKSWSSVTSGVRL